MCTAPGGYAICGGKQTRCDAGAACGCYDWQVAQGDVDTVSYCAFHDTIGLVTGDCVPCGNGYVCVPTFGRSPTVLACVPWEIGKLYEGAGAGSSVRYADLSLFTGQPVGGLASSCPTAGTERVCGGGCGTCMNGEMCVGLSPKRRVGFCENKIAARKCGGSWGACGMGLACFTFVVEPAAQALADEYGYCMTPARCADLATRVGGKCIGP